MIRPKRLVEYPWVVVRIECVVCPRRGAYRLARLAARYGPDRSLDGLLADLAHDCPWWRSNPRTYDPQCGACFVDLERALPPLDVPNAPVSRQRRPDREDVPGHRPATPPSVGSAVPMLSGWTTPMVTIVCRVCGRRDGFRKDDLLAATPGDARLTDLLVTLTLNCPRHGVTSVYERCGARFEMPPP